MRYLITAQSPCLVIGGVTHQRGAEVECDRDEKWEQLGWVVPVAVPPEPAPEQAPEPAPAPAAAKPPRRAAAQPEG